MNLSEFKAWFEGFTENMDEKPTAKQWARIQAKVKLIADAPPTSYPIYIDRWVNPQPWYRPYWATYTYGAPFYGSYGNVSNNLQAGTTNSFMTQPQNYQTTLDAIPQNWNSADAFKSMGRAEAESMQ